MLLTIKRDRSWLDRAILRATWKRDILPADVTASLGLWWAWVWRPKKHDQPERMEQRPQ